MSEKEMTRYRLPYGNTWMTVDADRIDEVLESNINQLKAGKDQHETVLAAMEHPIGSLTLERMASGKKTAVIIISDHTRPVPSKYIIPHMLSALRTGNPEIAITLLVATGCHRGTRKSELIQKLGPEIVEREQIVVHDCDHSPMVDLGTLPSGARLIVNELAVKADLLLAEGFIEPHFFAGFSGGRKSVLPGICARQTVLGNHCSQFIDSPFARAGILEENPIHRDMAAAARMAKLAYIVNVVLTGEKQIAAAFAGDAGLAHEAGCDFLKRYCRVGVKEKGDIAVVTNGGAPLDQNLYQAVKGLCTAEAAVKENGTIIMCAECADGIGGDNFYRAVAECECPEKLLEEIRRVPMEDTVPDQWQYQILMRILEKHAVYMVTSRSLEKAVSDMKMTYAPSLEDALQRAGQGKEHPRIVLIPDGVSVIVEG